ncbi:MAG: DegT/DnrJ/EryC1/StrS aminotransferase family protein [Alphaproteobacteria bacterium]|nr:DegT/DnrJ/EryC1/StrS aminotransferase family protein [Alphaproteobacteria bacterium]
MPFADLGAQYRRLKGDIDARMAVVMAHGRFINGPEVAEFETALAGYAGVAHAVACASGTDALTIALLAAGVGPGDAVFVPAFTFTATAEVVLLLGARPVFVDVDEESYLIDPADLERRVAACRERPRAVIAVDLFGQAADYAALSAIAAAHDMLLLADAAQSLGGALDNRNIGALAPVTATSFFPAKPLGCYGDGGALLTEDGERAAQYRSICAHGKGSGKYDIVRVGLNSRLDTLQAAVLLAKLPVLDDEVAARERIALRYDAAFADRLGLPARFAGRRSAWAQYTLRVDERDAMAAALRENGIPSAVYYPLPLHLQPAYAAYGDGPGTLPVSEGLSRRVLSLPIHPYLDEAAVTRICDGVLAAL